MTTIIDFYALTDALMESTDPLLHSTGCERLADHLLEQLVPSGFQLVVQEATQTQGQDQWCPVCHSYHQNVGEKTDAGIITRPCLHSGDGL